MTGKVLSALRRLILGRDRAMPSRRKDIEREELSRIFGHLVLVRVVVVPVAMGLAGWLAWIEPSLWRRSFFQGALIFIPAFFLFEWIRYRRQGMTRRAIAGNLAVAVLAQLAVSFASGGVESPFLIAAIAHRPHHLGGVQAPGAAPGAPGPGGRRLGDGLAQRQRPHPGLQPGGLRRWPPGGDRHQPRLGPCGDDLAGPDRRPAAGATAPQDLREHPGPGAGRPAGGAARSPRAGRGADRPLRRDRPRAQEPAGQRQGPGRPARSSTSPTARGRSGWGCCAARSTGCSPSWTSS